jgi:hypothetical protein
MRVAVIGEWQFPIYEEALAAGFRYHGACVLKIGQKEHLGDDILSKLQKRVLHGPQITALNSHAVRLLKIFQPDIVFARNPVFFLPKTFRLLRTQHPRAVFATYNNDNPFEDGRRFLYWRHYLRNAQTADINYFFRERTHELATSYGIPSPRILHGYYVEGLHRPVEMCGAERTQVLFVGHYEDDGREEHVRALLSAGIRVQVCGPGWNNARHFSALKKIIFPAVFGDDYVRRLCSAEMAIVFLSSLNKDTYTTRCFEIPACGTLMLAPRTGKIESIYRDGEEAVLYGSVAECVARVLYFSKHKREARMIAECGRNRCLAEKNSNIDRAGQVLLDIARLESR